MGSLFWRLFLGFWLVISALLLTHWGTTWLVTQQFESSDRLEHLLRHYAESAAAAYETDGPIALRHWQQQLWRSDSLRAALLDGEGLPLVGVRGGWLPTEHGPGMMHMRGRRPLFWRFNYQGTEYTLAVFNPKALRDPIFSGFTLLWRISLSLGVVGLLAWWMARYLTRPIERLQQTSRQLAEGDLNARAGAPLTQRRDELGELGRDFDRMATRLQSLLEGQQQLLRDVSHELRTPLARQRVALELARRKPDPSQELDRIEQQAEQLDALIEEILRLVRLDSPEQQVSLQPQDLVVLLHSYIASANYDSARVRYKGPESLAARVDSRLLGRALDNLISNALKYTDAPIEVHLSHSDTDVRIAVKDRGAGIEEEKLSRIFEPFYRVDNARNRQAGGWGLGLAICARAITLQGGSILARNRAAGGLSVEIHLPLR